MYFTETPCCALMQMSATNDDSLVRLSNAIEEAKIEAKKVWTTDRLGGQRSVFCITTPFEKPLEAKLKALDFKPITKLPRRNGYPEGELTMWMLSW